MNGEENRPSADTTLAVILGVSKCPDSPNLAVLPGSANSTHAFYRYVTTRLGLPSENVRDLFDSAKLPADQLREISEWLLQKKGILRDLIVFYSGHGVFTTEDHKFFLATHFTKEFLEPTTSIQIANLATILAINAPSARKYLIFD